MNSRSVHIHTQAQFSAVGVSVSPRSSLLVAESIAGPPTHPRLDTDPSLDLAINSGSQQELKFNVTVTDFEQIKTFNSCLMIRAQQQNSRDRHMNVCHHESQNKICLHQLWDQAWWMASEEQSSSTGQVSTPSPPPTPSCPLLRQLKVCIRHCISIVQGLPQVARDFPKSCSKVAFCNESY